MPKKYCYLTPTFPTSAYIGLVFVKSIEDNHFLYPLTHIYPTVKSAYKAILDLKKELYDDKKTIIYHSMVIKIKFHKTYPLRQEHWTYKPDTDRYNSLTRGMTFLKMINDVPQFYQIMVLPYDYNVKKNKWRFINWIPILITAKPDYIDGLIMDSDQGVETSADSMAFYTIESIRGLDLDTGKLIEPSTSITKTEFNC